MEDWWARKWSRTFFISLYMFHKREKYVLLVRDPGYVHLQSVSIIQESVSCFRLRPAALRPWWIADSDRKRLSFRLLYLDCHIIRTEPSFSSGQPALLRLPWDLLGLVFVSVMGIFCPCSEWSLILLRRHYLRWNITDWRANSTCNKCFFRLLLIQ